MFQLAFPNPETELIYHSDFQLLIAVILSAQCTDVRVNLVTKELFAIYPDAKAMAVASENDLLALIKSISYPNNKSKYLAQTAQILVKEYGGVVPQKVELLMQLPGVGRKTAHVITSVLYQAPHMAVDTHVFRISHRIGLVSKKDKTPLAVEKKLVSYIPQKFIYKAHHWLILHGRYTCTAKRPKCTTCMLQAVCKAYPIAMQENKIYPK